MKPKYTTEELREAIGNLLRSDYTYDTDILVNRLFDLFTAQQQALIEEIEKDLQKLIVQVPADKWRKGHNDGLRSAISTLEAIRKELK